MKTGPKGLELIKSFESFVPYVYDDKLAPVKGKYREWQGEKARGTLTIGYGHTNAARDPLKIKQGLRISEKQALDILANDLSECEAAVNKSVHVDLTQGEFDALTSFAFNCGTGNLQKLIKPLNAGDYDGCCAKFGEYIRSKGEVMRGLVRRRKAEQALWNDPYNPKTPEPDHQEQAVPKVTSDDAPSQLGKLMKSKTSWAAGGTLATSVVSAATDWKIMAVIATFILVIAIIYFRSKKP